jgi:hypothetical protein
VFLKEVEWRQSEVRCVGEVVSLTYRGRIDGCPVGGDGDGPTHEQLWMRMNKSAVPVIFVGAGRVRTNNAYEFHKLDSSLYKFKVRDGM